MEWKWNTLSLSHFSLFLGDNTEDFVQWLVTVLERLEKIKMGEERKGERRWLVRS